MQQSRLNQTAPATVARSRTGGKVFIEKGRVFEDLVLAGDESPGRRRYVRTQVIEPKPEPAGRRSPGKKPEVASSTQVIDLKRAKKHDNPHAEAVELMREKREQNFPVIIDNVQRATNFLDELDRELQLLDEAKRNKTRRQFEDWNTNVHGEIQKRIQSTINNVDSKQLNHRKNHDYQQFLDVTNHKAAIFRDIIIESEYDPLEPNRHCIKAKTQHLPDPVKISEIKAEKENSMLQSSEGRRSARAKPIKQLGKDTLNVELWASGKIEATPYGTFAKMMNKSGSSSDTGRGDGGGDEKRSLTMQSHIHFDHFGFPKGRDAIDVEMPKGKRIYPKMIYADPSRVFGKLPADVEREVAEIRPPENRRPASQITFG